MPKESPDEIGSRTAKGGFDNEHDVIRKFNSWPNDKDSQTWVIELDVGHRLIEKVHAHKVSGSFKADLCVTLHFDSEPKVQQFNFQAKLVSSNAGFNQIDKRWVDSYVEMWNLPPHIENSLKRFTGEIAPQMGETRDSRRTTFLEMPNQESREVVDFFRNNKLQVVSDLLRGKGPNTADWILITRRSEDEIHYKAMSMNDAIAIACNGDVEISKRGSLLIGQVLMQRKGGDAGRDTSKMLQFKLDPTILLG